MFSVIQNDEAIQLQSDTSTVTILPQCGAILNNWLVQLHDRSWSVIEGYDSPADFYAHCEAKGFRSAKLSPYVCRMNKSQYDFNNQHYTIGKFELAGNAIHGLLYNNVFTVVHSSSDAHGAQVVLQHNYDGSDAGYPFTYTMQVTYTLRSHNALEIVTSVTNTHNATIPMADGWHPYFTLGDSINNLAFTMQTESMVVFDEALVPTGELVSYTAFNELKLLEDTFLDNCFVLVKNLQGAACTLTNIKEQVSVAIYPGEGYPYLQVYTPPHRNSIAIENLSAAPDAFNNHMGLVLMHAGETSVFRTTYQVSATT